MHVNALLYDYTVSVNVSAYASCVMQFVIFVHALYVFLTFLGTVPVILFLLLACNIFLTLLAPCRCRFLTLFIFSY